MRIFKAIISMLLIVVFVALLLSSYSNYRSNLSTAGLIDAASTIANHLVVRELALETSGQRVDYAVDPAKLSSLEFRQAIGEENFSFNLLLKFDPRDEKILGPYGPEMPAARPTASLILPITVYENYSFKPGKLEVKVWR
ncbi:MAG: hypothetical protein ACK4GQ_04570, partial [Candidatus Hadarchaeales archaeon]